MAQRMAVQDSTEATENSTAANGGIGELDAVAGRSSRTAARRGARRRRGRRAARSGRRRGTPPGRAWRPWTTGAWPGRRRRRPGPPPAGRPRQAAATVARRGAGTAAAGWPGGRCWLCPHATSLHRLARICRADDSGMRAGRDLTGSFRTRRSRWCPERGSPRPGRGGQRDGLGPGRHGLHPGPGRSGSRCGHPLDRDGVGRDGRAPVVATGRWSRDSSTSSTGRIPDGTDVIRPSAAPAMNTMTTPSAEKKPSCSMIRMNTVVLAGEPPMATWLFHSGLSTVPEGEPGAGRGGQQGAEQRGVPAAGGHQQDAAEEHRRTGQDLQPQAGRCYKSRPCPACRRSRNTVRRRG